MNRTVNDSPAEPGPVRTWRGLLATADQLGRYAWTERRLFEVLGAWAVAETDPQVKVLFDAQSREHAWHAEVLFDRLPELREVDADQLIIAPSAEFAVFVDQVGAAGTLADRLVGVHGVVVPHLLEAYRFELSTVTEVADASLRRWLGFIIADLAREQSCGEELLRSLTSDRVATASAVEDQRALEQSLEQSLLQSGGVRA